MMDLVIEVKDNWNHLLILFLIPNSVFNACSMILIQSFVYETVQKQIQDYTLQQECNVLVEHTFSFM